MTEGVYSEVKSKKWKVESKIRNRREQNASEPPSICQELFLRSACFPLRPLERMRSRSNRPDPCGLRCRRHPRGVTNPFRASTRISRARLSASRIEIFARVKELVTAHPSLAKASWDWGFGDWETALGAASHVGNRPIAEFLIEQGAPPTIFSAAMLGQLDIVKAYAAAIPSIHLLRGPHGIPLSAHARAGGAQAEPVLQFFATLGAPAPAVPVVPLSDADRTSLEGRYTLWTGSP